MLMKNATVQLMVYRQVMSVLRKILAMGGVWLVSQGYANELVSNGIVEIAFGAISAVISLVWGIADKMERN